MFRFIHYVVPVFLFLSLPIGCHQSVSVTGTVKFSDGSPLTVGEVHFDSDEAVFSGLIKSDGSYALGSGGSANGIKPGLYRVGIVNAVKPGETKPGQQYPEIVEIIAVKYRDSGTSGISCDVKGKTKFDITVEKP